MIKIIKTETSKYNMTNILEPEKIIQGTHMVYQNTNDEGNNYFMAAFKSKINQVKRKKLKKNFITNMLFTHCYINLHRVSGPKRDIICVEGVSTKKHCSSKGTQDILRELLTYRHKQPFLQVGINIEPSMRIYFCTILI